MKITLVMALLFVLAGCSGDQYYFWSDDGRIRGPFLSGDECQKVRREIQASCWPGPMNAKVKAAVDRAVAAGLTVDQIVDAHGIPAKGSLPEIFQEIADQGKKFYTLDGVLLTVQDDPRERPSAR